jgi:hypothetical protein
MKLSRFFYTLLTRFLVAGLLILVVIAIGAAAGWSQEAINSATTIIFYIPIMMALVEAGGPRR